MKQKLYAFAIGIFCYASGFSQLIFSESFDYPAGNLAGNNGGTGFAGEWTAANQTASATSVVTAGSISATFGVGGRATLCNNATNQAARVDRRLPQAIMTSSDPQGTAYWLGFWFRVTTTLDASTYGLAAQLLLTNYDAATTTWPATDMRVGFGKTSNIVGGGTGANMMSVFSRAANSGAGCSAQNWPINSWQNIGSITPIDPAQTWYVLVKLTKGTTVDSLRIWHLAQPPTGSDDPVFTSKPNGDFPEGDGPILFAPLRSAGSNCPKDGITGIRFRVEGGGSICAEFDELRLANTLNAVLPVQFGEVKGEVQGKVNYLSWETLSEQNNRGFHVEKSADGLQFHNIGFVAARGQANMKADYSFIDVTPFQQTYYRIKQTDNDGRVAYSKTILLNNRLFAPAALLVNPVRDRLFVQMGNSQSLVMYRVTDMQGRAVSAGRFSGVNATVNVSSIAAGMYFIQLQTADGKRHVLPFVKQ